MYSLILMSAMAGTPDVAAFGYGTGCVGTTVSYSASYSYSSCSGCRGPLFPRLGLLAQNVGQFARSAFHGSCHGSSCYGSCYGASCFGSACYGSCYGSSCFGSACYGSCYGSGCYGSSCFGCVGSAPVIYGSESYAVPVAPIAAPIGEHYGTVSLSVELPAAAKLYVDGHLIEGGGESRQFHTPELPRGQAFFYEVKAVVEVNGKLEVEEKRVVVKAGESLRESFPKLLASVKAAGSPSVASN